MASKGLEVHGFAAEATLARSDDEARGRWSVSLQGQTLTLSWTRLETLSRPQAVKALGLSCAGLVLTMWADTSGKRPAHGEQAHPQASHQFRVTVPGLEGDTTSSGCRARCSFSEAPGVPEPVCPGPSFALTSFLPHVVQTALRLHTATRGKRKHSDGAEGGSAGAGDCILNVLRAVWAALDGVASTCVVCLSALPTHPSDRPWHCGAACCVSRFADGPVRQVPVLPLLRAGGGVLASLFLSATHAAALAATCGEPSGRTLVLSRSRRKAAIAELDAFQPVPSLLLLYPDLREPVPWLEPRGGGAAAAAAAASWRPELQEVPRNEQADADKLAGLHAAQAALASLPEVSELAALPDEAALARALQYWPEMPHEAGLLVAATPFFRYRLLQFVLATAPRDAEVMEQPPALRKLLETRFAGCGGAPAVVALRGCGGAAHEARFAQLCASSGAAHALHGSPLGRWHSILRHGLIPLSRTGLETSGAAHGAGVYVASHSSTSLFYSLREPASLRGSSEPPPSSGIGPLAAPLSLSGVFDEEEEEEEDLVCDAAAGLDGLQLARLASAAVEAAIAAATHVRMPARVRLAVGRAAAEAAAEAVVSAAAQGCSLVEPVVMALVEVPAPSAEQPAADASLGDLDEPPYPAKTLCPTLAQIMWERYRGAFPARPARSTRRSWRVGGPFATGLDVGVQPTADHVVLRYLLVFPNKSMLQRASHRFASLSADELAAAAGVALPSPPIADLQHQPQLQPRRRPKEVSAYVASVAAKWMAELAQDDGACACEAVAGASPVLLRVEMGGWSTCAPELAEDLERFFPEQNGKVSLELRLDPQQFPMRAPRVRVLAPPFAPSTGFVTRGGGLALSLEEAWTPSVSLPSFLRSLRAAIAEGAPRLLAPPAAPEEPYNESIAHAACKLAAMRAGWIRS